MAPQPEVRPLLERHDRRAGLNSSAHGADTRVAKPADHDVALELLGKLLGHLRLFAQPVIGRGSLLARLICESDPGERTGDAERRRGPHELPTAHAAGARTLLPVHFQTPFS